MQVQTSWKLIMGCLMVLGGLSMPVAGEEEPQLVFRAPSQQEKKVEHKQVPDAPQTLKDALGYDFDDEAFVRNYQCDPDKGYRIHMRNREPFLMTIDDFLTPGECDHLIAVGLPLLKRSLIVAMGGEEEGRAQSEWRTSSTAFMPRSNDKVFQCIEQRISKLASLPAENIEPLQLVRYFPGQQYREHYDWFHNDDAGKIELSYGGQRVISMFAYDLLLIIIYRSFSTCLGT